jgi:uracil phosphoribosyltransferase
MTITSITEARLLYELLQDPALCDVDAKTIIFALALYMAEQARTELRTLLKTNMLLVPILRGGLLLYPAFAQTFAASAVGLVQVAREGSQRVVTYECLPALESVEVVLYLDAVAGSGRTIERASQLVRERYATQNHYACVLSASAEASAYIRKCNVNLIGLSTDETIIDDFVSPDLGMRDAGDLVSFPKRPIPRTPEFPIAAFERFHNSDEQARSLRSDLIYQPTIDLVRSRTVTTLLDFGCGSGQLTEELAKYAEEVVGYDPSAEAVALAKARTRAQNIRYTSHLSPEMTGAFDFIVCCMVLNSSANFTRVLDRPATAVCHSSWEPRCRQKHTPPRSIDLSIEDRRLASDPSRSLFRPYN